MEEGEPEGVVPHNLGVVVEEEEDRDRTGAVEDLEEVDAAGEAEAVPDSHQLVQAGEEVAAETVVVAATQLAQREEEALELEEVPVATPSGSARHLPQLEEEPGQRQRVPVASQPSHEDFA